MTKEEDHVTGNDVVREQGGKGDTDVGNNANDMKMKEAGESQQMKPNHSEPPFNYEPLLAKETPEVGINRAQVEVPESIDRLGESVYKLNKYLNLKKDIKALQKENCVRDDIKKKLDLKERWLSTPSPVESLSNKFTFNSRTLSRDSLASGFSNRSTESALPGFDSAIEALKREEERRAMEDNFDKIALTGSPKGTRLKRSDSLEKLLREKEEKQQKLMQPLKNLESMSFANTMDFMKSKISAPKVKAQDSCDLSRYFPDKKVDKKSAGDVNKTQKTLKDVDLAQYFATNEPKGATGAESKPPTKPPVVPKVKVEPKEGEQLNDSDFNMFDQLMDGAIDLKIFMKHIQGEHIDWSEDSPAKNKRDSLQVNYDVTKSPSQEYKQFFGNMEDEDDVSISLDDLIDEHAVSDFESIVSSSIAPSPVAPKTVAVPEKPIRMSLQKKKKHDEPPKKAKPATVTKTTDKKPKRIKSFSKPVDPNRGIESCLVPPKPRTIRNIPGMILNTMKGKKKSDQVAPKPKAVTKTKPKETEIKPVESKPAKTVSKIMMKMAVPKSEPEKMVEMPPVNYVPDPKVAKYFFDDVSILGDLEVQDKARSPEKSTAGHEIFEDALETVSMKRMSEIDRMFERIDSTEDDVFEPKTEMANETVIPEMVGDENIQMVDNAAYVPSTPERKQSGESAELRPEDKNKKSPETPELVKVEEKIISSPILNTKKLESNLSEESNKSTASRRAALLKMHIQSGIPDCNGFGDKGPSLPPTPTPRRRSKSKSTEPTSPIPPRRLKKTSTSGSVDSEKIRASPLVQRKEREPEIESRRKVSEPEKRSAENNDTEPTTSTSLYPKRRSGDYSDYSAGRSYQYTRDPIPTTTSYLLNKSRDLHDRKREFMNERVSGNNPYMRRMLSREEREEKINAARSTLGDSRSMYSTGPSSRSNYSGRLSPFDSSSSYYTPSRTNYTSTMPSAYSSAYTPTTSHASSHSFMDHFRRAPQSPPRRDGCIIS